jgi:NAD+ synthase (glutamine-hydrolysing)
LSHTHGFLRVAAAMPLGKVADVAHNADRTLALLAQAEEQGVAVVVFPELNLTGYTCGDLFHQHTLLEAARTALTRICHESAALFSGVAVVGVPFVADGQLFNCAAVLHHGELLGLVPKAFLPTYKEFYEHRWFSPAAKARSLVVMIGDQEVPFGLGQIFQAEDVPHCALGVEICEDLWTPAPPSSALAVQGATVLANLSASNEVIGKAAYRRQLVASQSGRCVAAYVFASCGVSESSTDVVFGGHCLIAENGAILAENKRFQREETLLVQDVDLDRLVLDRLRMGSFSDASLYESWPSTGRGTTFTFSSLPPSGVKLLRHIDPHPFVPQQSEQLRERCEEIFSTQVAGLRQRLEHTGSPRVAIGVSGGLDSTLALLVVCKTMDAMGQPRSRIRGLTMPGFGTTARTKNNALDLMRQLGIEAGEADIRELCLEEMRLLDHQPFGIDLTGLTVQTLTAKLREVTAERRQDLVFENVQARMRTNLLMNAGFVIGTGDLSELALGWCTYNGDHMSMYNPNVSIPKTLVKFLVRWAAENEFEGDARRTLLDIVATMISPELLPSAADEKDIQSTEATIGPYELHDFFLYHLLRFGSTPEKMLFLASQARFDRPYPPEEIRCWLKVFLRRFFANQFKRSCLPDGPKVGSVALSPRGDWRMPSDAQATTWLAWAEE